MSNPPFLYPESEDPEGIFVLVTFARAFQTSYLVAS